MLAAQIETGVQLQATGRVWLGALLVAAGVFLAWLAGTRRSHVAGIGATATLWLLASKDLGRFGLGVLVIGASLALYIILRRVMHGRLSVPDVTGALNLVTLSLLAVAMVQGTMNGALPSTIRDLTREAPSNAPSQAEPGRPDIYLVVLDGYPRADVLAEVSGMDNAPFLAELERRGFTVAAESRSSYMYTDLLVTALLHGRQLVDIPALDPLGDGRSLPALGRSVLNAAPLVEQLRDLGYVTIANAQAWDEPGLRAVDIYMEASGLNEFEREMWWNTLPGSLMELRGPVVNQDALEPWVHDGFEALERSARIETDQPRFAFIHVPSPHFPIIFASDGSRADPRFGRSHPSQVEASRAELREAYAGQVAYLNGRLIGALDEMDLAPDAIVILMGDHGPEFGLDWNDGPGSDLAVRFGAFFAARAPAGIYDDNANVAESLLNLLREWGATDVPSLDDRFFASDALEKHATMVEVESPWPDR